MIHCHCSVLQTLNFELVESFDCLCIVQLQHLQSLHHWFPSLFTFFHLKQDFQYIFCAWVLLTSPLDYASVKQKRWPFLYSITKYKLVCGHWVLEWECCQYRFGNWGQQLLPLNLDLLVILDLFWLVLCILQKYLRKKKDVWNFLIST